MAHLRSAWFRSTSNSSFGHDVEKRRLSNDSDEVPSLVSSDHSMLSQSTPPIKNYALRYHVPRRRFTRWFTCGITTILVIFALYLVGSSWQNEAAMRLGLHHHEPPAGAPPPKPHAWESFPLLKRYYGGIRTLVRKEDNVPEFPGKQDDEEMKELRGKAFEQKYQEDVVDPPTFGGFQKRDEDSQRRIAKGIRFDPYPSSSDEGDFEPRVPCSLNTTSGSQISQLLAYEGVPSGFPDPGYGCYDLLGLRNDICFERYGKLGPYGFGYSRAYGGSGAGLDGEREGAEDVWDGEMEVDYREVKWADAQLACMEANKHRFREAGEAKTFFESLGLNAKANDEKLKSIGVDLDKATEQLTSPNGKRLKPRTAVIIRTWKEYNYDPEDLFYLRGLINELSLQSGTEYVVHFLIHVKNNDKKFWTSEEAYQKELADALPAEFAGMGTLWSESQMKLLYPGLKESWYRDLPVYGVYRSTYLPLQYFAHMHPQYDFFWHWEMDARYTGHFYHLFERLSEWAKQQPRKGLWERNARFYVPDVHGDWTNFTRTVEAAIAGADKKGVPHPPPVWGPQRPIGGGNEIVEPENDPVPPTSYEEDDYSWGVGEDADFISLNPLFDPHLTNWILAEDVTGYSTKEGFPPRRIAIITGSRLSRRLLETMHKETSVKKHTMFSEMWPGSCALHHGLKAVYAPHPVHLARKWPTDFLAETLNNGAHGASGGSRLSTFSDERQHNFIGTTWYYHAEFAGKLWKRWLGYKVEGEGGERFEMSQSSPEDGGVEGQGEGRMCLPGMLLHPIKQVDLVYEHKEGE